MDKDKYFLTFEKFISKMDNLDNVEIPKGYIQINAKKIQKRVQSTRTQSRNDLEFVFNYETGDVNHSRIDR